MRGSLLLFVLLAEQSAGFTLTQEIHASHLRRVPSPLMATKTKPKAQSTGGSLSRKIQKAGFVREEDEQEVSDAETALRWVGVQGGVDFSILCAFAYHYNFDLETAINTPELKFLIVMPAFTVFCQILRRFGSEELPSARTPFEDDPIVKYLGGVRGSLRNRMRIPTRGDPPLPLSCIFTRPEKCAPSSVRVSIVRRRPKCVAFAIGGRRRGRSARHERPSAGHHDVLKDRPAPALYSFSYSSVSLL